MSDRWVFLAAFVTLVLVVAGAFAIPEFFFYELLTGTVFVVIAVMVFFGGDKFPYMLGMIAPVLWLVFDVLVERLRAFAVLFRFLSFERTHPLDTPLHGIALLMGVVLAIFSARAWRKQVTERFLGKTFFTALIVALIWIGILAGWMFHMMSTGVRL
jgi:flagellar biosynthesis protein FliQ